MLQECREGNAGAILGLCRGYIGIMEKLKRKLVFRVYKVLGLELGV